jgi:hypothetical protein
MASQGRIAVGILAIHGREDVKSGGMATARYQPRPVRSLGIRQVAGWRINQYVMTATPEKVPDPRLLSATAAMAAVALPAATATHRVGFLLAHQARPACFVLVRLVARRLRPETALSPRLWITQMSWWSSLVTRWAASGSLRCSCINAAPGSITYLTARRMISRPIFGTSSHGLALSSELVQS